MLLGVTGLTGCGASQLPAPTPTPSTTPPAASPASPPVPDDGVTLRQLGFRYGPPAFSVPRTAQFAATADQPNGVTLVLSAPAPDLVAGYLRRALPAAGLSVTSEVPSGPTLTFAGAGWWGSFTATDGTSAIILRPG